MPVLADEDYFRDEDSDNGAEELQSQWHKRVNQLALEARNYRKKPWANQSLNRLFQEVYRALVYRTAQQFFWNDHDRAEDEVAEFFVRILIGYQEGGGILQKYNGGNFIKWAYTVIRNQWFNERRRERKHTSMDVLLSGLESPQVDERDSKERQTLLDKITREPTVVESVEVREILNRSNLTEVEWMVLELEMDIAHHDKKVNGRKVGMRPQEKAAYCGMNVRQYTDTLKKAQRKVQTYLRNYHPELLSV